MAINGTHAASSNYVTTAASAYLQPGRTITVMAWANPNVVTPNGNYYTLLGTASVPSGSGWGVSLRGISGAAAWEMFFTANGTNFDDFRFTSTVATGTWDHVAWVLRSDGTEVGYLNGVAETLVQSANAGAVAPETSRGLQILYGDAGGNGSFGGSAAFVRIYDGELGAAEIVAEMASKRARNRRLPVLLDIPDPYLGVDYGPVGLHVATVTGTVTWAPDPPLPEPVSSQLTKIRDLFVAGGGPTEYTQTNSGSITPTGALVRQAGKLPAGAVTPAGALVRSTARSQAGTLTPQGALVRQAAKALAGAVTPTGALVNLKAALRTFAGTLTPAGALTRQVGKSLAGTIAPAGSLQRLTARAFAGALGVVGALAKQTAKRLLGALTPAGAVTTSSGPAAPARDLQLTVGRPETKWSTGLPTAGWSTDEPRPKWTTSTPEV